MSALEPPSQSDRGRQLSAARWGRRLGVAAFLFFLFKGLAWLLVPAVLAYWVAT